VDKSANIAAELVAQPIVGRRQVPGNGGREQVDLVDFAAEVL